MTDRQGSELELFYVNGQDASEGICGALHISSKDPANKKFLEELQELMDAAIQLGVEEGFWKKEDAPKVRAPLELAADENGRAMPGQLVLVAEEVRGFLGDEPTDLDGVLGEAFSHTEVEFAPIVDEDGTPRVVCCLYAHLDPRNG